MIKLQWLNVNDIDLSEPFFDNNLIRNMVKLSSSVRESDLIGLYNSPKGINSLDPNGFIFHMSRCGSTLISNLLRVKQDCIVMSEPEILDEICKLLRDDNYSYVAQLYRNAIHSFGQCRMGTERSYVIKYPSYSTLALPLITELFPSVPRLFLYRDPVEVLVSNMNQPHQEWIYWNQLVGQSMLEIAEQNTPLENCAMALKNTCENFLKHYNSAQCLVVNYADLTNRASLDYFMRTVMNKFNIVFTEQDIAQMLAESNQDAKQTGKEFASDSTRKGNSASVKLREIAHTHLTPVYDQLERLALRF